MHGPAYIELASTAVALLGDPAVAESWDRPSALPEFTVRGLAGHLARQVIQVRALIAADAADGRPITLLEHYGRSRWVAAVPHDEVSADIRRTGESEAAGGAAALVVRTAADLAALRTELPAQPADRVVHLPWGPWSLALDDFLVTRLLELAVHCDDLAVSVGVPTPDLPAAAVEPALDLLTRLAARRHGQIAVLRALSRAERAPATIAAL